ncbi:NAD(P)-binding protein [Athelia psychrophila]|uniref:NAD(P)-binding protein n=1 Tax=Athelia psychrophila TaxID=1759441 RepID=A0A167V9L3_9AGAM|nr:NAD(P)-binding protein [Fibularhizoctonia sp. CBS 109695]
MSAHRRWQQTHRRQDRQELQSDAADAVELLPIPCDESWLVQPTAEPPTLSTHWPTSEYARRQVSTYLPVSAELYVGKTVIVTGSNIGFGKEAAKRYARLGAETVIFAIHSLEKGGPQGCKGSAVQVWQLDLSSYKSVQQFGARVNKELPRLDVLLVENAGIATPNFRLAEGCERTITVNVISTFLLFFLCLPKSRTLPRSTASGGDAYSKHGHALPTSKLLGVFCVRAFAELHPADKYPITVNTRGGGGKPWTCVCDAVYTYGPGVYDNTIPAPGKFVTTPERQKVEKRLWNELAETLEKISPSVTQN